MKPTSLSRPLPLLLALLGGACSEGEANLSAVPGGFPVPMPTTPILDMEMAETLSVEVEDQLFLAGKEMVEGDVRALGGILSGDFEGSDLSDLPVESEVEELHGSMLAVHGVAGAPLVDGAAFLDGLAAVLGDDGGLEYTRFIIHACEFQPGRPTWGKADIELHAVGRGADGSVRTHNLRFDVQVMQDRAKWLIRGAKATSMESRRRERPMFTDIGAQAGVSYSGMPAEDATPFPFRHLRLPYNGAAAGDANGDGIWDIFACGKERNFLYLGRGDGSYEEVAVEWGVLKPSDGTGAVFFDYDNDGDQDLFVAGEGHVADDGNDVGNRLRMYRNDGGGYTDVSKEVGLHENMFAYSVSIIDYDNDGWLDIYLANYGQFGLERNNSWRDSDNGDVDALFRNLGGERFVDVREEAGLDTTRWSFAVSSADYDRDGDQDVYVAHDYGPNSFYVNQGDGTFRDIGTDLTAEDLGFGMGVNWGDLDNDGDLDLYIANMYVPVASRILGRLPMMGEGLDHPMKLSRGNTILIQEEDGGFHVAPEELGGIRGMWAWGCAVNDFDLDGRLDIFCTNGMFTRPGVGDIHSYFWRHVMQTMVDATEMPMVGRNEEANNQAYVGGLARRSGSGRSWAGHERDKLWFNRGEEGFLDLSDTSGTDSPGDGRAALALDIDDDGDLDLFLNEWSFLERNKQILLRNDLQTEPTGFLKVQLRATTGQWQAAGAEVIVTTPAGPCSQVLSFGTGFLSANPPELVFGLGEAEGTEVEVIWPGGARESFGRIDADSRVLLVEGSGTAQDLPRPGERR